MKGKKKAEKDTYMEQKETKKKCSLKLEVKEKARKYDIAVP